MMEHNEWEKISRLLERALELPAAGRQAFLAEIARSEGEAISDEIEELLEADQRSDGFLKTSALSLAAQQLAISSEPIQPNAEFGNYRILSRLGAGGMGEVYLAEDTRLRRKMSIKLLPAEMTLATEPLS
jgi:eukaryotic-like serine/threonine-protein kinase